MAKVRFENLIAAVAVFTAGIEQREEDFFAISGLPQDQTGAAIDKWFADYKEAGKRVQLAFYEDTKSYNTLDNCQRIQIDDLVAQSERYAKLNAAIEGAEATFSDHLSIGVPKSLMMALEVAGQTGESVDFIHHYLHLPVDEVTAEEPVSPFVLVFGSNTLGAHLGGAAKAALDREGAILSQGFGPQGNSFAIPTCSKPTGEPNHEISAEDLKFYIDCFLMYAYQHPEKRFKVTQIGCGLAGWTPEQVAPMFANAPSNCYFDSAWKQYFTAFPGKEYWGTF